MDGASASSSEGGLNTIDRFASLRKRMRPQQMSNGFYHVENRVLLRSALIGRGNELMSMKPTYDAPTDVAAAELLAKEGPIDTESLRPGEPEPPLQHSSWESIASANKIVVRRPSHPASIVQAKLVDQFARRTAGRRGQTAKPGVIAKTFFECSGLFDDSIKAQAETYYQHNQPYGGRWRGSHVSASHPASGRRFNLKIPEPVTYS